MIIEKCSQIEFDLCIWTYLGRWGTDVICVSAEMRFCLNHYLVKNVSFLRSLPARGVWIEIRRRRCRPSLSRSLPARGVWIEIGENVGHRPGERAGRSPQGECGLKLRRPELSGLHEGSLPARGVWIEISTSLTNCSAQSRRSPQGECGLKYYGEAAHLSDHASLPARGVWIEISSFSKESGVKESLPARGVWIEIANPLGTGRRRRVTPRKGSVD